MPRIDPALDALAALAEPKRRTLYEHVVRDGGGVSRDAAARAAGVTRALAAFHLDKLVDAGLLETEFRRVSGRSGPGAGRPAKLYRRPAREVAVSLPPRQYDLAGALLADAVASSKSRAARSALGRAAREHGRRLGEAARGTKSARASASLRVLATHGYEPVVQEGGTIRQRNCPFHALAAKHPALVCGMNLELMEGVLEGLTATGYRAVLDPKPGFCCVAFVPKKR